MRRAFLCGTDKLSGRSFEHRRAWIEERIRVLSSVFAIDICAYAVMSNHYHLVVKLNPSATTTWSDGKVLTRWTVLHKGPMLVQQFREGKILTGAEQRTLREIAAVYRRRLVSLSWFMKCLNEPIARRANTEDGCTGHFWEARFQSQSLLSEKALFAAMAYVDLNPVRAKLASTPEESDYTSVRARIRHSDANSIRAAVSRMVQSGELNHFDLALRPLMPFSGRDKAGDTYALPMRENEYLKLVDTSARSIAYGKSGRIDPALAPILDRLGLSPDQWVDSSCEFRHRYRAGNLRPPSVA